MFINLYWSKKYVLTKWKLLSNIAYKTCINSFFERYIFIHIKNNILLKHFIDNFYSSRYHSSLSSAQAASSSMNGFFLLFNTTFLRSFRRSALAFPSSVLRAFLGGESGSTNGTSSSPSDEMSACFFFFYKKIYNFDYNRMNHYHKHLSQQCLM